jgi:hypothetical protein
MKKWQYILGLLVLIVVVFGGYYFYKTRMNTNKQQMTRVDYELIDRSNYGLYGTLADDAKSQDKYKNLSAWIFTDTPDWKRFWETDIRQVGTGGFGDYPRVDFDKKRVLALLQGVKPTGGYYIEIKEMSFQGKKLIAKVNIVEPKDGEMQTQAVSSAYDIIKFDKEILTGKNVLEVWDVNTNKLVLTQKLQ